MDAELINQIVKQVLTALGQTPVGPADLARVNVETASPAIPQSGAGAHTNAGAPIPAALRAAQKPTEGLPWALPGETSRHRAPPRSVVPWALRNGKKVFLTAEMLHQRLAGLPENASSLELEPHEFLTPSAEDLAADRHVAIQRKQAPLAAPSSAGLVTSVNQAGAASVNQPCAADSPSIAPAQATETAASPSKTSGAGFGLVTSRLSDAAGSAIRAVAHAGLTLEDWNRQGCWLRDSRTMCEAILAGTLTGGIVVLPYAADAMLLTSRFRGIRPVQGTRPQSVASALRHYGANLLVIEHAFSTFHEMREMIRLFVAARPEPPQTAYGDLLRRHVREAEQS